MKRNYDKICEFHEGFAIVCQNMRWGFIDENGKEIGSIKYDKVRDFCDGFAAVCIRVNWGFIDKNGNEIIAPEYAEVKDFDRGVAIVQNWKQKWGIIDSTGSIFMPCIAYNVPYFNSGGFADINLSKNSWDLIKVSIEGFQMVYNSCSIGESGEIKLPVRYGLVIKCANNIGITYDGDKYGYIGIDGNRIAENKFDRAEAFQFYAGKVYAKVQFKSEIGIIDDSGAVCVRDGNELVSLPIKYDWGYDFNEGLSRVIYKNEARFINRKYEEVLNLKKLYSEVGDFHNGLAKVKKYDNDNEHYCPV